MLKSNNIFFISVLVLFFLYSCSETNIPQNNEIVVLSADCTDLQKQCDSLTQVVREQDNMMIKVLTLFSDIQYNFHSMKERKERMFQYVREADEDMLEEIKKNFSLYVRDISSLLTENRQKLTEFKHTLSSKNIHIGSLESAIFTMEGELNMRNNEVKLLKKMLNDKDTELSLLENMVAAMNEEFKSMGTVIKQQQEQLNAAWYCVADKKTLSNGALISKKGKVLSIDASLTTKVDIQNDREIPIQAKRYELLTAHPPNSYQVIQSGGGYVEKLQILDPQEFWSICKYCVIQTRN
jgi:chromosome segregation ATPase